MIPDPYIRAALRLSHPDASPTEVQWNAEQLRETDRERAAEARHGGNEYRRAFAAGDARWAAAVGKVYGGNGALTGRDMSHPTLPESAFDWPIYRAAMAADTFAALWGQAAPGMEERILNTLARCAGMREYTLSPEGDEDEDENHRPNAGQGL